MVILPFWEICPYSWDRDGSIYRHVCWVLDDKFDAKSASHFWNLMPGRAIILPTGATRGAAVKTETDAGTRMRNTSPGRMTMRWKPRARKLRIKRIRAMLMNGRSRLRSGRKLRRRGRRSKRRGRRSRSRGRRKWKGKRGKTRKREMKKEKHEDGRLNSLKRSRLTR